MGYTRAEMEAVVRENTSSDESRARIPYPLDSGDGVFQEALPQPPFLDRGSAPRINLSGETTKSRLLDFGISFMGLEEENIDNASLLYEAIKRGFDIFVSATLLTLASPVMFWVALAVRLTSPGRALYLQKRLTKGGRIFDMYKFRSMVVDAEAGGPAYAKARDPRVTPVGKFIRVTRLDELPQLINVLMGDMSLIGPRPERPEMARKLAEELPDFNKRLAVRAGLTGWAQVEGGYAADSESYKAKLALDLEYIANRSIAMDCKIAWKTISVILTGHGAR